MKTLESLTAMRTLEDILRELGSEDPFLLEVETDEDGHKQPFTDEGAKAYGKLIEILYAVGTLTNTYMGDIVEELDSIACEEW